LPEKREELFYAEGEAESQLWVDAIIDQIDNLDKNSKSLKPGTVLESAEEIPTQIAPSSNTTMSLASSLLNNLAISSTTLLGNALSSPVKENVAVKSCDITTIGKLQQLLEIFQEVLKLEQEIFLFPIELRTLIPDYYRTMNPDYVSDFQARILKLSKKIDQIEGLHGDMRQIVKQEMVCYVLNRIIEEGSVPVGSMKDWVATEFHGNNPQRNEARKKMAPLLKWYLDLYEAWEAILQKD
jgi:hypothetical protein